MMHGGEDDALLALERRSQLELAKDLYRGTEAMPTLDSLWTPEESDDELRERADQCGLYGPDYLPTSHRWWTGFTPVVGQPARDEASPPIVEPPPIAVVPVRSTHVATWIAIAGGRYQLGLTAVQARSLARALAEATVQWATSDPDATLRDVDEAERMGGNPSWLEPRLAAAFPAREVELERFTICATPVTNGEYADFVAASGARPPSTWNAGRPTAPLEHPVIGVSWIEANVFAEWANARLPAEDEWELAARNHGASLFPWGDAFGDRLTWMIAQPFYEGWRVGSRAELASRAGVHDLVTARSEWTASQFAPSSGATVAALQAFYPGFDEHGWIRRGLQGAQLAPCSVSRCPSDPTWQADGTGFRLVQR